MILSKITKKKFSLFCTKFNFYKTFKPTFTTFSLINFTLKYVKKNFDILDLGCGSGIITACLINKKKKNKFYLSDLNKNSTEAAEKNLKKIDKKIIIKTGDCFKPWNNFKFNLIINDISGVSKKISKISPWFVNIPSDKSNSGNYLLKSKRAK